MTEDMLISRARRVWTTLAGVPVGFPAPGGAHIVASATSALCPPGWVGLVSLGGATIGTVPAEALLPSVRTACVTLPDAARTDPARLREVLPIAEVLGPATLAYCERLAVRPQALETVPAAHPGLAALLAAVSPADAGECGLDEITSPAYVLRDGARIVAAAGYVGWPERVAHLGVLTAPDRRGRGLARVVAGAAVAAALAEDLLPQWRARPEPSRRVARALGFRELGTQLSVRLAGPAAAG